MTTTTPHWVPAWVEREMVNMFRDLAAFVETSGWTHVRWYLHFLATLDDPRYAALDALDDDALGAAIHAARPPDVQAVYVGVSPQPRRLDDEDEDGQEKPAS